MEQIALSKIYMKLYPEEAEIVKRIYKEFIGGESLNRVVRELNRDKIPTKKGLLGGWNLSTVSRILKNERYKGLWIWKKWKNAKDPKTGKIKQVLRPEKEWLSSFREDLVIIEEATWEAAQKRWQEINGSWPVRKKERGKVTPKSYIHANPTHLLAGLLKCASCRGAIILLSGKGGGYYGCYNSKRKTCANNLLVPRRRVEKAVISALQERLLTAENLAYVYKNLEGFIAKGLHNVPEEIKKKKLQYEKSAREVQNYLNFIKTGNLSKAVSEALGEAERRNEELKEEIKALEFQKENTFKAPPREWIEARLKKLRETLSKNTTTAALVLKEPLGTIRLEPVSEKESDFTIL